MRTDYQHRFSAHCETGVASGLLHHHGVSLSEPMVFGIGAGIYFAYVPFIRMGVFKLSSYRSLPGSLFRRVCKRLNLKPEGRRFFNRHKAMRELDCLLESGIPVGVKTSPFWLPYLTDAMRIHFNAHNIVVYGKEDGDYLVSDTVFLQPVRCPGEDLSRARFAKGIMAPRGYMYYLPKRSSPTESLDLTGPIVRGIRRTCFTMLHTPVPMVGVKGIRHLADQVRKWPRSKDPEAIKLDLSDIITTQEVIGTGGGGFRFMYAAFLKEAATVLGRPELEALSVEMTAIGDRWRDFASLAARFCKNRLAPGESYDSMPTVLMELADREEQVYRRMETIIA